MLGGRKRSSMVSQWEDGLVEVLVRVGSPNVAVAKAQIGPLAVGEFSKSGTTPLAISFKMKESDVGTLLLHLLNMGICFVASGAAFTSITGFCAASDGFQFAVIKGMHRGLADFYYEAPCIRNMNQTGFSIQAIEEGIDKTEKMLGLARLVRDALSSIERDELAKAVLQSDDQPDEG
jgi:hypothetical protein